MSLCFRVAPVAVAAALLLGPRVSLAQTPPPATDPPAADPSPAAATATVTTTTTTTTTTAPAVTVPAARPSVTWSGYVEAFYSFNFNLPNNNITAYRGFDNRHNTFSIANAVLGAAWALGPVTGNLAVQFGTTPETYYLAEPGVGASWGVGASGPGVWKYLQQANVAWRTPTRAGNILLEMGLFLSPIGPEGMAIKDQWNWSRSNLFVGLPFYHTGLRLTSNLSDRWAGTFAVYNGWNNVTDNNDEKAIAVEFTYTVPDRITVQMLYFGGVERSPGALEGRAWRHLLDVFALWRVTPAFSLLAHADVGIEPNALGTSSWYAGALYARLRTTAWLYLAARGDFFHETAPQGASPIFWLLDPGGQGWVSSGTFTVDARPHDNVSIRLEYRHDQSAVPMFFSHTPASDGVGGFLPTVAHQDTVTLGMTTWF